MDKLLPCLQNLVTTLLALMPTIYQKETLEAIFGLFLLNTGNDIPEHCKNKSSSAISRFLNQYQWSTRSVLKVFRNWVKEQLLRFCKRGRRPHLQIIIELTTLEKRGKFEGLEGLIRTFQGKKGLHLVVMYLVIGQWRIPWNYRIYRGKGHSSPADLARRLLTTLPKAIRKAFKIMVLADSAFNSVPFLVTIRRLKFHATVGVKKSRKLMDGRAISLLHGGGQHLYLKNLPFPVSIGHYYFKRDDGKFAAAIFDVYSST